MRISHEAYKKVYLPDKPINVDQNRPGPASYDFQEY